MGLSYSHQRPPLPRRELHQTALHSALQCSSFQRASVGSMLLLGGASSSIAVAAAAHGVGSGLLFPCLGPC
jgi:hypothetical protein